MLLQRMVATALKVEPATLAPFAAALRSRDRAAFSAAVRLLFEQIPRTLAWRASAAPAAKDAAAAAAEATAPQGAPPARQHRRARLLRASTAGRAS